MFGRTLVVAAAFAAVLLVARAEGGGGPPIPGPETFPSQLSRIVSARVHHTRISTVRNTNARRIGRSLAGLRPTWVTGMIRYAKGQHPNRTERRAYREIRRIVANASPQVAFDVTLNAKQYRDGDEIQRMMSRIRSELDNDGWFFDFFSAAYRKRPRMIRAAIASAHAHGEFIGGNVFGLPNRRPLPLRADFASVQDFHRLTLNLSAIRRAARKLPVVYHLNNDPDKPRSGGCRFIEDLTTAGRRRLIRHRAKQGARVGFRISYPALFPECLRGYHGGDAGFLYSYNAFRDPPMARTIRRLLNRYD